ncbi:MAG: aminotransferase class I/II-fold pyridoxal phosphate-dependent enzyme, partial [Phycisphaerales bacterium]|nr:aminotransferase class I/II-fold pyridoxal phosphate-dependent enzyme [Phycisphaerales bacterium]
RHLDVDDARRLLARNADAPQRFLLTDGVFSMDGTIAPLDELVRLARDFDAMLIVDDAHGSGVVGPDGRGTPAHFGVEDEIDVVVGTLSKAFGGQGGFVTASQAVIDRITNHGRAFIYSTALAPALVAAADAALDVILHDGERRQRQRANITVVRESLEAQNWRVLGATEAPMLALHVGEADVAVRLSETMLEAGVFAPAIRPPTVHPGESRIRLVPTALHSDEDIAHLINVCSSCRSMVTTA